MKTSIEIKRHQETSRDIKRHQETSRDIKRHQETSRDIKRHQEDIKRYNLNSNEHKMKKRKVYWLKRCSLNYKLFSENS